MEILLKAIFYILGYIVGGVIFLAFLCHDEYKEMKYDKQFFRDKENKEERFYAIIYYCFCVYFFKYFHFLLYFWCCYAKIR